MRDTTGTAGPGAGRREPRAALYWNNAVPDVYSFLRARGHFRYSGLYRIIS